MEASMTTLRTGLAQRGSQSVSCVRTALRRSFSVDSSIPSQFPTWICCFDEESIVLISLANAGGGMRLSPVSSASGYEAKQQAARTTGVAFMHPFNSV